MGFLTNISISNDYWHEIKRDPKKLVDAISIGMNDGIEGPINVALGEREDARSYQKDHDWYVRQNTPQGVTVHHARHYDEPQVIVNPYGHQALPANEIPYAIRYGWLNGSDHRRQTAEQTAKVLEDTAREIREALKRAGNDPA